jgi:hypothetical protein
MNNVFVPWHPCTSAPVNAHGVASRTDDPSACKSPCNRTSPKIAFYPSSQRASASCPQPASARARAKVSVCTTVGLTPSADAHDRRALPCPAPCHARARVAPAPQQPRRAIALGTPAISIFAGRARTRRANPVAVRRRSIYRATHRALPARLPHYADYILRLQDTKPESFEINAAPSARRITTRRRLAGVRHTLAQRP